jgi:hypothetical protein
MYNYQIIQSHIIQTFIKFFLLQLGEITTLSTATSKLAQQTWGIDKDLSLQECVRYQRLN